MDPLICQTFAASPAEPGELPFWLSSGARTLGIGAGIEVHLSFAFKVCPYAAEEHWSLSKRFWPLLNCGDNCTCRRNFGPIWQAWSTWYEKKQRHIGGMSPGEIRCPGVGERVALKLEASMIPTIKMMFSLEKSAEHWKATFRLSLS